MLERKIYSELVEWKKRISANIPNTKLVPGNTLIFLDEIQRCGNARTGTRRIYLENIW